MFVITETVFRAFDLNAIYLNKAPKWDNFENEAARLAYNERFIFDSELGYRSKDFDDLKQGKSNRKTNLLFLGDSITEIGLYIERVKESLNRENQLEKVTITNLGSSGYNTTQEFILLKRKIESLNPDLVILQFCMNDFSSTPLIVEGKDGWHAYNLKFFTQYINSGFVSSSELLKFLFLNAFPKIVNLNDSENLEESYGFENVKSNLEKIDKLVSSYNANLLILAFPFFTDAPWALKKAKEFRKITQSLNLENKTIHLIDQFQGKEIVDFRLSDYDFTHLSQATATKLNPPIAKRIIEMINKPKSPL